jgi:membrane-associated phospholipid phosphatase
MSPPRKRNPTDSAARPSTPHLSLGSVLTVTAVCLLLFVAVAMLVRYSIVEWSDVYGVRKAQEHAPYWLTRAGRVVNVFGAFERQTVVVVVLAATAFAFQRYLTALALLLLFSTTVVEVLVKRFLFFPRAHLAGLLGAPPSDLPDQFLEILPTVSAALFPSGHVARLTFLVGLLGFIALRLLERRTARIATIAVLFALALLVGVTRVVLDEHFPSDVIGGYLLGFAALAPAVWLVERDWPRLAAQLSGGRSTPRVAE